MVVVVVHRKVGGQQSAVSARDGVPTLGWKENHNSGRLTPITDIQTQLAAPGNLAKRTGCWPLYLPECSLICPRVCLSRRFLPLLPPYGSAWFLYLSHSVCLSVFRRNRNKPGRCPLLSRRCGAATVRTCSRGIIATGVTGGMSGDDGASQVRRDEAFLFWRVATERGQDRMIIASIL